MALPSASRMDLADMMCDFERREGELGGSHRRRDVKKVERGELEKKRSKSGLKSTA